MGRGTRSSAASAYASGSRLRGGGASAAGGGGILAGDQRIRELAERLLSPDQTSKGRGDTATSIQRHADEVLRRVAGDELRRLRLPVDDLGETQETVDSLPRHRQELCMVRLQRSHSAAAMDQATSQLAQLAEQQARRDVVAELVHHTDSPSFWREALDDIGERQLHGIGDFDIYSDGQPPINDWAQDIAACPQARQELFESLIPDGSSGSSGLRLRHWSSGLDELVSQSASAADY